MPNRRPRNPALEEEDDEELVARTVQPVYRRGGGPSAPCCRSGSAADTQAVADIVTAQLSQYEMTHGERPAVHVAANMLEGIVYQNKDRLSAGLIVAGWDPTNGGTVYNIPLGGGLFKGPWAIGGSGSTYIYGYCDATFREDWGQEETVEFVKNALALAMSRDGSSGGTIRLAIITEAGVERVFVPGNELPPFGDKL
ncbi:hypothetical protein JCM8208_001516 [Rhodotorula glutinis]